MHMSVAQAYAFLEHSSVVELPAYIRRVPGSIPGVPIFQNGGIAMISEFVEYVKQAWKNKPNVISPLVGNVLVFRILQKKLWLISLQKETLPHQSNFHNL